MIDLIKTIKLNNLWIHNDPGKLCQLPYPGHPQGCPNFNKSPSCPPHAPKLETKYKLTKDMHFVLLKYNIKKQEEKIQKLHPTWSKKHCRCCLYWQSGVRKKLKEECSIFLLETYGLDLWTLGENQYSYELIPEALGVNVFTTAKHHGYILERNPKIYLYKIAFIGMLK